MQKGKKMMQIKYVCSDTMCFITLFCCFFASPLTSFVACKECSFYLLLTASVVCKACLYHSFCAKRLIVWSKKTIFAEDKLHSAISKQAYIALGLHYLCRS